MTATDSRDTEYWSAWFWKEFLPKWVSQVQDGPRGVFDLLEADATADASATKSILAQARTLFTLSHIALISGDPAMIDAANKQAGFITNFRKSKGLYRCAVGPDGTPTGHPEDEVARSYDQTFVILGLMTWNRLSPNDATEALIDDCWHALQTTLTDSATGLLLNNDMGTDPNPAQNPHMHLYEACLQAYRMTQNATWLDRAADLRLTGLKHFFDEDTGSLAEFIKPDLSPLDGVEGQRREVGHQCEWAWLLLEEAELAKIPELTTTAQRLQDFADNCGYSDKAPLQGAAYDAVLADGTVHEDSTLLWPQTEAIKALALRHVAGDMDAGARAKALMCLMFEAWFKDRLTYVNQLDPQGNPIWSQALTRLMYHVVMAMTEGARAGLWSGVADHRA